MESKLNPNTERKAYSPPAVNQIRIDNQISVVLMSAPGDTGNDPQGNPPELPDGPLQG